MDKIKINKNLALIFFVLAFCLIGIFNLVSSNGLIFSELKKSIIVEFSTQNENAGTLINETINKFTGSSNIAQVDRMSGKILFQNTDFETINNDISSKLEGSSDVSYTIIEQSSVFDYATTVNNIVLALLIISLVSGLGFLYIFVRPQNGLSVSSSVKTVILFLFNSFVSAIIFFSFVGLLSRLYYIQAFEVNLVIVSIVVSAFFFLLIALKNLNALFEEDLFEFRLILRKESLKILKFLLIPLILLFFGLSLGLGAKFVITALLFVLAIIMPLVANVFVTNLYFFNQLEVFEEEKSIAVNKDSKNSSDNKNIESFKVKTDSKQNKKSWNKRFKKQSKK